MKTLINLMLKIVLMIGLGVLLKKKKVITNEVQKGLSNLLVMAVLPLNIIASSRQVLTEKSLRGAIFTAIFALSYYILSITFLKLLSKRLPFGEKKKRLIIALGTFANTGFIGFPFVEEIFGSSCIIYAVIYNMFFQIFFYTYGIYLLSGDEEGKGSIKTVLKLPVNIASFICIFLFLLQIHLPEVIHSTVQSIGSMTVPLSMIVIGLTIADMKIWDLVKDPYSYLISFLRLVAFPFIAFIIAKAANFSGEVIGICVLITGLPSGTLNVIVAQQKNCEPEFAARAVVQSMIFMLFSLPLLFWLVRSL